MSATEDPHCNCLKGVTQTGKPVGIKRQIGVSIDIMNIRQGYRLIQVFVFDDYFR